jgi:hypothetical protein
MKFTLKLLANLRDPRGGDALDRVINGLSRLAPGGVTTCDVRDSCGT